MADVQPRSGRQHLLAAASRRRVGPSTYWIDIAEREVRRAAAERDDQPFLWGNITQLRVEAGRVLASLDIDEPSADDEAIALDDFLDLLAQWRQLVRASTSGAALPETYRRNPHRA